MLKSDVKNIGIVPAFLQGRVGENEPVRLFEGKQALLVLED